MSLNSIKGSVQEVAEAIAAVLKVDVTIIDKSFNRIAATGKYKKFIGNKIPGKCLFELVIKEKRTNHIKRYLKDNEKKINPSVCESCEAKERCTEFATIGYPIIMGDEVIGVIGINIFNEKQLNIISEEFDSMIIFLNRLSTLLVGNIVYYDTIKKLQIQTEETNHIIDSLSHGIMCVDNSGILKYINHKGKKLLDIKEKSLVNTNIKDTISNFNIKLLSKEYKGKRISIHGKNESFLIKSSPIIFKGERVSNIIEFNKKIDEVQAAYKLFASSKIIKFEDIMGSSNNIKNVKLIAKNIAKTDSTVLLRGESGTGKELFARAIHFESKRYNAPFIAVNCASIPDNLLESEFFGYEGGAFSGAKREGQMGKFELANGGTIFLDEIGDLPLHLQPKILRVLQEQSFTKIGGKEEICVDVRIIAATNRDLESMVKHGQFRQDLYYRLNVIPIYLPSLKDRGEDIILLSEYLIDKFCERSNLQIKQLSKEVKDSFKKYSWPGNIRELENVIEYIVNTTKENIIYNEHLPKSFKISKEHRKNSKSLQDRLWEYERNLLISMMDEYGEDGKGKERIARELDINLSTLYRKLNKYNLQK
ncbi:sigma-54 interaction domain-containing protein [Clostridium botulinum]|uniref:Putative sigma-54 dependent transcriptional regulator n=1 Tax=Clostridium botulinum (strain Langeland / NCTC 10281 / Type F) TaxID=441772 RepID=A7GEX4_CLOBL|nr:sigma 54-interacting transcriptional regulator [Clostridium botulinum]ABS40798.1 putative sigma-54 dependent transcriptional regulator [Clostridium botulinum F str. Langeland]KKM42681.1 ATPase AAA [Clostridium botulinum]MBY6794039.1 sigma 54-interacting transcriptional regulator [Clostridium botulinum]MBY6937038.1 sigma 54-interacting transcriptional regulator [Clostridium botulinum]MBY6944458.1 sigma 54-interacting transcriptional regulator [Clostridium botulinum]